jgi:hypothetical protein
MKAIRQATLNWCRFLQTGKRVLLMAAVSSILAVGGLGPIGIVHAAGTATLSVLPATLTKNVGDTVQFDIVANIDGAGDPSNAIQANLDYPAGIFDSGTAACGPAMSVQAQASVSGGLIQLACATLGAPVTGIVTVGTVTLHSIAATAPSSPNVTYRTGAGESAVVSSVDSSNMLTTTTGGTYTINTVSAGGSAGGGGTTGGSTSGTSSSPKAPKTGFALLEANPSVMLGATTLAAGLILGLARRARQLIPERINN